MAGADIRRFSTDRRGTARTFLFGIGHGALMMLADTLLYPTIVLTLFVAQLTSDPVRIALVPVIGTTVWLLPQILFSGLIDKSRRQLPWAAGAAIVQTTSIVLLAYIGYRTSMDDAQRLRSFFFCYVAYNIAAGFASIPSRELVVRAIPREQRGLFFLQRNLWGAVLAVGAGLVARGLLGPKGPDFPRNFTSFFVMAAAALAAATYCQIRMREPGRLNASTPQAGVGLAQSLAVVADPNFTRFILFRIVLTAATLADPFLIVYGQRELNIPMSYVGAYLIAATVARFLAWPLLGWIERRGGHRSVLQATAMARMVAPLVALILPYLADTQLYQDQFEDNRPIFYAFGLVFVALGFSLAGQIRGNFGYMMAIAPADRRPAYHRVANIALAIAALAPLIGARLIERYSYDTLFAVAAIVGLSAIFISGLLTDTHTRARAVAQSWRLRGARS